MYLLEIFTSSILPLPLSHWILLLSYKLIVSLSMLDAINLQLFMNLSWIFLRTYLPSLFSTPTSSTLILVLKLIYLSLFSAMASLSSLFKFFPSFLQTDEHHNCIGSETQWVCVLVFNISSCNYCEQLLDMHPSNDSDLLSQSRSPHSLYHDIFLMDPEHLHMKL